MSPSLEDKAHISVIEKQYKLAKLVLHEDKQDKDCWLRSVWLYAVH